MPHIRERRPGVLVAEWIDPRGRKRSKSFNYRSANITRAEAMKQARAHLGARYQERQLVNAGLASPEQWEASAHGDLPVMTLVDRWAKTLSRVSEPERRSRVAMARRLFKGSHCIKIRWISASKVLGWLEQYQRDNDLSPRSYNRYLSVAKNVTRWARLHGYLVIDPLQDLQCQPDRGGRKVARVFTPQEVLRLLHYSGKHRHCYRLMAFTGLRVRTVQRLHMDWWDSDALALCIPAGAMKNRVETMLPVPLNCHDIFYVYWYESRKVFATTPIGTVFDSDLRRAGVEKTINGKAACMASFRHTFTTFCAQAGISNDVRARLRGDITRDIGEVVYTDRTRLFPQLRQASDQLVQWWLNEVGGKSLSANGLQQSSQNSEKTGMTA